MRASPISLATEMQKPKTRQRRPKPGSHDVVSVSFFLDEEIYRKFKARAALDGRMIHEAAAEAFQMWTARVKVAG